MTKILKSSSTDALQTISEIRNMLEKKNPVIVTSDEAVEMDPMSPENKPSPNDIPETPVGQPSETNSFVESQLTREKVDSIIEKMKGAGYRDIYFDPKKGFIWNMYPPASYIKVDFGSKFNPNGSFFINIINKLVITEESLKEPTMLKEKLEVFMKELDSISSILKEINNIYPIVY